MRLPLLVPAPCRGLLCAGLAAASALAEPGGPAGGVSRSEWTHLAGDAARTSTTGGGTLNLSAPTWVVTHDLSGREISFIGQSSPVVTRDFVLAMGTVDSEGYAYLFCVDRRTGRLAWQSFIDLPEGSSYASPAVDLRGRSVIVASGYTVRAFDTPSGVLLWDVELPTPLVNASPVVTQDLWPANRVFITDSDPFGTGGRLYSINISRRLDPINPHELGDVVWSVPLGGTSGNSPAYDAGRVYVTTVGNYLARPPVPAKIMAFDARARQAPAPLWTYSNTVDPNARFFGGLEATDGAVYAATYDFGFGGGFNANSNLVKVRAAGGALVWSAPCNRTNAIPIVLGPAPGVPGARVLVSGGLHGFSGTAPSLQLFEDHGASAALLWDTALSTWSDADGDGHPDDGEYLSMGGWTHQPAVSTSLGGLTAFVGTLPANGNAVTFPACDRLSAIDLDSAPTEPYFILSEFLGAGSSPAIADDNIYTIGAAGLHAFGPAPFQFDVNGDGEISIEDLIAWEQGYGSRDVNMDGVVDERDRRVLEDELRRLGL